MWGSNILAENRLHLGWLPQIETITPNGDDFFNRLSSRFGSKDCTSKLFERNFLRILLFLWRTSALLSALLTIIKNINPSDCLEESLNEPRTSYPLLRRITKYILSLFIINFKLRVWFWNKTRKVDHIEHNQAYNKLFFFENWIFKLASNIIYGIL